MVFRIFFGLIEDNKQTISVFRNVFRIFFGLIGDNKQFQFLEALASDLALKNVTKAMGYTPKLQKFGRNSGQISQCDVEVKVIYNRLAHVRPYLVEVI